jgi:hypothetical protein
MNNKTENTEVKEEKLKDAPLHDAGGFYFSSSVKIHDPNTNEVLVQMRGDN